MNIKVLKNVGFCNGVNKTIETVYKIKDDNYLSSIYILGELIHNDVVTKELEASNIKTIPYDENTYDKLSKIEDNSIIIFASHGHKIEFDEYFNNKSFKVYDTTCPVINKIFTLIKFYKSYNIVYVGKNGHDETNAALSLSPNMYFYDVNKRMDFNLIKDKKILLTCQTTISENDFNKAFETLKKYSKDITVFNGLCGNVLARVKQLEEIPNEENTIIVVGDVKSSNTDLIYKEAIRTHSKSQVFKINSIDDINFECKEDVYITSGTSAHPSTIQSIVDYLKTK